MSHDNGRGSRNNPTLGRLAWSALLDWPRQAAKLAETIHVRGAMCVRLGVRQANLPTPKVSRRRGSSDSRADLTDCPVVLSGNDDDSDDDRSPSENLHFFSTRGSVCFPRTNSIIARYCFAFLSHSVATNDNASSCNYNVHNSNLAQLFARHLLDVDDRL